MIPLLFTLGLCALTEIAPMQEIQLDTVVSQEKNVCVQHLSNGVKTCIRESPHSSQTGVFKIVLRNPSCQAVQYSYEGSVDSLEGVGQFFASCKERIQSDLISEGSDLDSCHFSYSDLPLLGSESPIEMAVIAVGDFNACEMESLIEKHLADVTLIQRTPASTFSSAIQIGQDETISKVALSISYPTM